MSYTPFEGCPHTWCVGCGTCHDCERENPPAFPKITRKSTVKGQGIVLPRLREEDRGSAASLEQEKTPT